MNSALDPHATIIRDPLYSRVPVDSMTLALMSTPEFLRLQRVKQLGWVYVVWPGATHTRYEHSLGVYHLARRALEHLLDLGQLGGLAGAVPSELRAVLAAALLHDVGHYPYSHGIEELGAPIQPHEHNAEQIITRGEVARVLAEYGVEPEAVVELVHPGNGPRDHRWRVYRALLSGALDVDKLDYLPRDARACNVPYGGVDVERLLEALRVLPGSDGPVLGITEKGISPLHSLILARQEMFDNVYWHHTNRACMVMLLRAVQDAMEVGALPAHELAAQDDASLLVLLSRRDMPPTTRELVEGLTLRKLHKRAVEFARGSGEVFERLNALFYDQAARRRLELELCARLSELTGLVVAEHEVLLDIPKPERWEVDVPVYLARPPVGLPSRTTWSVATGTRPESLAAYEAHQRRIRLVTTARLRDRAWELRDELIRTALDCTERARP